MMEREGRDREEIQRGEGKGERDGEKSTQWIKERDEKGLVKGSGKGVMEELHSREFVRGEEVKERKEREKEMHLGDFAREKGRVGERGQSYSLESLGQRRKRGKKARRRRRNYIV